MEDNSNTLRILVGTDCHLGYTEKDEIRRYDCFQAFEEVGSIAEQKEAIEILRRHCLNDRPVLFQVVSDQTANFQNAFAHVNYEDPHFNVGLPVFSIHGNHDDPAGVDNLSAVDFLSVCNLVKYFRKNSSWGLWRWSDQYQPYSYQEGSTAVALYGLENIRNERLNRMFQENESKSRRKRAAAKGRGRGSAQD